MDNKIDEDLLGNEKIEEAIAGLQQSPTEELLAHALTVVRRRMRENGQVIIAVEPNAAADQMKLQAVKTSDGNSWWTVFTSFDEEMKGSGSVMSTFMTDIGKVLEAALSEEEIHGVIINPWNRTLMLDKTLIRIRVLSNINVRFQGLIMTPCISSSDSAASSTFPMSVMKVDITLPLPFISSSKLVNTVHQLFPSEVFTAWSFIWSAAAFGSTAMIT